ncbi:hypothetical protein IMSHALPRED_009489 [Imshaugia aleurites]|uniref:NADH-ubiquinone oxidoreductase 21 kDa subunit n=1 Tax=Imshaugia aleurites TaxID=172621 RepID=A0A8H3IYY3_9LECA|nr:hypothetical protein IMSHALPRED_009489 [Imshaugia aleurites]
MTDLEQRPYVPARQPNTKYPLIDNDPHFKRVVKYARTEDYAKGGALAAFGPAMMLLWEKISPSHVHKGGFASVMRLSCTIGAGAGFLYFYESSILRFYGVEENKREVEMDMREMVDKVKRNEPLYGKSSLTPYMQGVASRNSRYSGVWLHVIPWFNFVNHDQHGVDTAKYYRQAERELAAEQAGSK